MYFFCSNKKYTHKKQNQFLIFFTYLYASSLTLILPAIPVVSVLLVKFTALPIFWLIKKDDGEKKMISIVKQKVFVREQREKLQRQKKERNKLSHRTNNNVAFGFQWHQWQLLQNECLLLFPKKELFWLVFSLFFVIKYVPLWFCVLDKPKINNNVK